MLGTLLESNAPRQRRPMGMVASIGIHAGAIVAALVATASAKPAVIRPEDPVLPRPVYAWPTQSLPEARSPHHQADGTLTKVTPIPSIKPFILLYLPKPASHQLGEVDPVAWLTTDSLGRFARVGGTGAESDGRALGDRPATAATVDRLAALLAPPRPRYPDQLRAAGVTGRVVVRLVVDTLGRVEPASVVVRDSSHDLFTRAVMATLPGLSFAPAEAGGRRVRMLVDLPFEFRLDR